MQLSSFPTTTLEALTTRIAVIENRIQHAESQNARRTEYQDKYVYYRTRVGVLREYEQRIGFLKKSTMDRIEKFRDDCLRQLEERVETILAVVYPDEGFKVSVTFRQVRGVYQSEVLLGKEQSDGRIKWGSPKSRNGGFVKQLVSFSIVACMNLLLGAKFLMMDEPFSSSDPENVALLKPVFAMMLESGLQIILIEHKENLFKYIDHNEILLYKHRHPTDEQQGFVEVVSNERKLAHDDNDEGLNEQGSLL